jgi:hypothetical protein
MSIEAMKQALEALENAISDDKPYILKSKEAITALRQAIEQAEKQEPVAFYGDQPLYAKRVHASDISQERVDETAKDRHEPAAWIVDGKIKVRLDMAGKLYYSETNVYAAPPQREWVGLTDGDIAQTMHGSVEGSNVLPYQFARAIEAKLKEKNNA